MKCLSLSLDLVITEGICPLAGYPELSLRAIMSKLVENKKERNIGKFYNSEDHQKKEFFLHANIMIL